MREGPQETFAKTQQLMKDDVFASIHRPDRIHMRKCVEFVEIHALSSSLRTGFQIIFDNVFLTDTTLMITDEINHCAKQSILQKHFLLSKYRLNEVC